MKQWHRYYHGSIWLTNLYVRTYIVCIPADSPYIYSTRASYHTKLLTPAHAVHCFVFDRWSTVRRLVLSVGLRWQCHLMERLLLLLTKMATSGEDLLTSRYMTQNIAHCSDIKIHVIVY